MLEIMTSNDVFINKRYDEEYCEPVTSPELAHRNTYSRPFAQLCFLGDKSL